MAWNTRRNVRLRKKPYMLIKLETTLVYHDGPVVFSAIGPGGHYICQEIYDYRPPNWWRRGKDKAVYVAAKVSTQGIEDYANRTIDLLALMQSASAWFIGYPHHDSILFVEPLRVDAAQFLPDAGWYAWHKEDLLKMQEKPIDADQPDV